MFFLIPLIYILISKNIDKKFKIDICLIFSLILCQGLVGWYMVKSGLQNDITVSHFRLSAHLSIAFIIISSIFWVIINILNKSKKNFFNFNKNNNHFLLLIFILFVQIISGAFVSGLDAGRIYQTWPLMGHSYFPNDVTSININNLIDFNNHSLVQFYHRNLAYLITIYILFLSLYIHKKKLRYLFKPLNVLISFLTLQIILGIFTLLSGLNIYLAIAHQISSVLLVLSAINLYYYRSK